MVSDDFFSSTDVITDVEPHMALDSTAGANLMPELDSDNDSDTLEPHPILVPPVPPLNNENTDGSLFGREPDSVDLEEEETFTASTTDLPEVIKTLQKQLLSGYTHPNHPSIDNPRGHPLTPAETLSLKHYIAWVDSRGTVKAYSRHAQLLEEATGIEILSLYMARKLAMEVTGLSSQLVDMCPKSCMAFTGEFKELWSCTYIRDKHIGACGEPRYDKKGHPRAQMHYTPIAPVIQSLYINRKTAEAMRYRHEHCHDRSCRTTCEWDLSHGDDIIRPG